MFRVSSEVLTYYRKASGTSPKGAGKTKVFFMEMKK
jgi:hypothetical protein